jgi:hypothetical protein
MAQHDPRVDAYIAGAAAFAQPILRELRTRVHAGCPDASETIKWGMPFFVLDGHPLCHMAAFKAHAAFGFWKGGAGDAKADQAMGQYGRLVALSDLPGKRAGASQLKAAQQRLQQPAGARAPRTARAPLPMPPAFARALDADPQARAGFDGLAAGYRRDYLEWIGEAKTEATAQRRIGQALAWLAEGRQRHWKHARG